MKQRAESREQRAGGDRHLPTGEARHKGQVGQTADRGQPVKGSGTSRKHLYLYACVQDVYKCVRARVYACVTVSATVHCLGIHVCLIIRIPTPVYM